VKILYVSPYPPVQDGIGNYTWTLANGIRSASVDVRVIVPRDEPSRHPDVIGAVSMTGQEYARVRSEILAWRPDVVHVQFAIAAFGTQTLALLKWLAALKRDLQVPIVVTLHEFTRESSLLPVVGRTVYRRITAGCDQLMVHTEMARNAVVARFGVPASKIKVIPHPSAQAPEQTASCEDLRARFGLGQARVLLAFGFVHVDKGLDDLVRALRILSRTKRTILDDVVLVVAGAVRPRHGVFRVFEIRDRLHLFRVMQMARRTKLASRVVLTGYVPAGEVATWFNLAEAVMLPYRRIEESGVACLARSFDTPVLASTAGGLAEQFAGSNWSCPPGDPAALASTLERFLSATQAERMLRPVVKRQDDLASVVASTLELYQTVTRREQGRIHHVS
jgi:glycosyltransferase involved in cell wall biosynthesis